jgi:hypothetical protein
MQLQEQLADLADALRIEPVRRLVQDEQLGFGQQRCGQAQPLPHAERVGLDRTPAHVAETHGGQRLLNPGGPRSS